MTPSPAVSLSDKHTFGLNARCKQCHDISHPEQLQRHLQNPRQQPQLILGQGSNTIFVEDFDGDVLRVMLSGITISESSEAFHVTVAAGENWHGLVTTLLEKGIYGFENLALIPGTVGAAPIQNIGAYGVELAEYVEFVDFADRSNGGSHRLLGRECEFGYRSSVFKTALAEQCVITQVGFRLPKDWRPRQGYGPLASLQSASANDIYREVIAVRSAKLPDPAKIGNAGSFFKNPVIGLEHYQRLQQQFGHVPGYPDGQNGTVKVPAAWLIDTSGFKGQSRGGIGCHSTQPLVLTNLGNGNGTDLLAFAREIRNSVAANFGIDLENEVRLIGALGMANL